MDLKEFIKETVSAIIEATVELQDKFEETGSIINPPITNSERDLYGQDQAHAIYRRVETVEFDVAVTAETSGSGSGKAALKILSLEASLEGAGGKRSEAVSRVKFSVPVVLRASNQEALNREESKRRDAEMTNRIHKQPPSVKLG